MKLNQRMPLQSGYTNNNSINNNNRVYNNLYSQNRINIINNNFEYSNQNQKIIKTKMHMLKNWMQEKILLLFFKRASMRWLRM